MRIALKNLVKATLKRLGVGITEYYRLQRLESSAKGGIVMELLKKCHDGHNAWILRALRHSKSQLGQDMFVLCELGFKTGGYFVEFGATNGVDKSNTYLLEKEFGWQGIVCEPARCWHKDLANNRNCNIATNCVWRESDLILTFNEVEYGELSTIESYSLSDNHRDLRKKGKTYNVDTISLEDMLVKYNAPREIDYLSIDTEGSEYEILSNFDFRKYKIRAITCEHNYSAQRDKIHSLLTENGYTRKYEEISEFDDWYLLQRVS
jgi:FkbM family methyltransferase